MARCRFWRKSAHFGRHILFGQKIFSGALGVGVSPLLARAITVLSPQTSQGNILPAAAQAIFANFFLYQFFASNDVHMCDWCTRHSHESC